eukprot:852469-Prorocentrum_minimum.AAC.2
MYGMLLVHYWHLRHEAAHGHHGGIAAHNLNVRAAVALRHAGQLVEVHVPLHAHLRGGDQEGVGKGSGGGQEGVAMSARSHLPSWGQGTRTGCTDPRVR